MLHVQRHPICSSIKMTDFPWSICFYRQTSRPTSDVNSCLANKKGGRLTRIEDFSACWCENYHYLRNYCRCFFSLLSHLSTWYPGSTKVSWVFVYHSLGNLRTTTTTLSTTTGSEMPCTAQARLTNFVVVVSSTTPNTVDSRRPAIHKLRQV